MSATRDAATWNAAHPIGTPVVAYPGERGGAALRTRTRSIAWAVGGHTAVVAVRGYPGGIALTHVDVLPPEQRTGPDPVELLREMLADDGDALWGSNRDTGRSDFLERYAARLAGEER